MDTGNQYGEGQSRVPGGYHLVRAYTLRTVWWALRKKLITPVQLRTWFALIERSAQLTARTAKPSAKSSDSPFDLPLHELHRVVGGRAATTSENPNHGPTKALKSSIRRLAKVGLIRDLNFEDDRVRFSFMRSPEDLTIKDLGPLLLQLKALPNPSRRVPLPLRTLRLLATTTSKSTTATILGHALRGLFYRDQQVYSRGVVKCSSIAETFGLHTRRIKAARAHLVSIGWLDCDKDTPQHVLNRHGQWFTIQLDWNRPATNQTQTVEKPAIGEGRAEPKLAPHTAENGGRLAPPIRNIKPSSSKKISNPKPRGWRPRPQPGGLTNSLARGKANWWRIQEADLKETERSFELLEDARRKAAIGQSQADQLNFLAAIEHALVVGTSNPPGLLRRIVEGKLWNLITHSDEDAAIQRLAKFESQRWGRGGSPNDQLPENPKQPPQGNTLSEDAKFAQRALQVFRQKGHKGDVFPMIAKATKGSWNLERWTEAVAELRGQSVAKEPRSVGALLGAFL